MRRIAAWLAFCAALMIPAAAVADKHFGPPRTPEGFHIEPAIQKLHHPTRLVFGPDGRLYIAQQTGEVVAVTLKEGKEVARDQVAEGKANLLGIALKDDRLWVSDTGTISVYTRTPEGRYANRQEIVTEIPHGLHENDGFAWGPDGKLYWGLGSSTDRGPEQHAWSGSIMRMNPDGTEVEVYAKGFRNPFGITFGPDGRLWVTDNGADDPVSSDELNLVVEGGHYGYPDVFEVPPAGSHTKGPVALFGPHNSTNGIVVYTGKMFPRRYQGGIFAAMWGSSFDDNVGRALGFVDVSRTDVLATPMTFISGLNRPLDVAMGPDGDLWVADFVPGIVYRVWYDGPADPPMDPPAQVDEALPPVHQAEANPRAMSLLVWAGAGGGMLLVSGAVWLFRRRR